MSSSTPGECRRRHGSNAVYLRLSLTSRCNLQCRYCRPGAVREVCRPGEPLSSRELLDLAGIVHDIHPLYKLRFTGGEPLLRPDVLELIRAFRRRLPATELCMTTNGLLLEGRSRPLRAAGLRSMNISLDTLDPERFRVLTGSDRLSQVLDGIDDARRAGFDNLKLNTVLLRSFNGDQLPALVRIAAAHEAEIRFVELMPIGAGAGLFSREYLSAEEALGRIGESFSYLRPARPSATAKRHVLEVGGREVTIGFITSVSSRFCDACDRLRLDSLGRIFSCLRDACGIDLREALRGGDLQGLREGIRAAVREKKAACSCWPARPMVQLGG
jgi:cyclic pyranopterin phosphate synthase